MTASTGDPLSPEEAAALGSGASFWTTEETGGAASFWLADGPHGVRKQVGSPDHLGLSASEPATCFPPAVGLAQSWDPELAAEVGAALGREAHAQGVGVLLGPGVNIKRDPRGGRNFEYWSEDPVLTGTLAAAWVRGVQGAGVGTSLKHFAGNEAEHDRMRASSDVDERPLREVYLRAFQRVVEEAQPWTVMAGYNKVNGEYVSANSWLLTDVLRGEWGFTGAVVSDWGAVADRVAAVAAGLDLQMPGPDPDGDAALVAAVGAGRLDADALQRGGRKVRELADRVVAGRRGAATVDVDGHHELARRAAARCVVLLRNDLVGGAPVLPLAPGASIAVIGEFAELPRFQGGGSSHVTPTQVDVPVEQLRDRHTGDVSFVRGFTTDGSGDADALRAEAVAAAGAAQVAVVFVGLAARQESEGFDRVHIELPADQVHLVREVAAVQPRTVLVLSHGGVVRLAPVADVVPAMLDGALLGQGAGAALADVLVGAVNPAGKLAETVPLQLQDVPAYLDFPGEFSRHRYSEGLHVGHRWYDARNLGVTFPFGHGLSYTTFDVTGLEVTAGEEGITATVTVTNTGDRAGREVVQCYVGVPGSAVQRPVRELTGFVGVTLEPGERRPVSVLLGRGDLSYWHPVLQRWVLEPGEYEVHVGVSSRDLRATALVEVRGEEVRLPVSEETTLGELMADPEAAAAVAPMLGALGSGDAGAGLGTDMVRMMASIPIGRLRAFGAGRTAAEDS
ncbi:glycoside hydrolase family 3 C-terminal domain-containing protein [Modestobacter sp. VKM Ac-2984]|uniref:glycoside hydrolase family 3 C-terminal domain-containing protein n=1 Tax=Modestobacter sp. VKM Ac-2984 TaxID=3004138 RepID=UPI0022AAC41C|nr:glycoside hydrolase family 3 C-terminal domain-containing protein [Modestobacter sp. VKM Ac-2984]MCZ2816334.1 glycoside hydrolase family 3 C-terminal domain-containing protein [Modestobacter sp. VKM Ac-2984]